MLSLPLWGQTVLPEAVHFLTNSEHLFIHPSAWNRYSRKFISKILHSPTPIPLESPSPDTPHSPVPVRL